MVISYDLSDLFVKCSLSPIRGTHLIKKMRDLLITTVPNTILYETKDGERCKPFWFINEYKNPIERLYHYKNMCPIVGDYKDRAIIQMNGILAKAVVDNPIMGSCKMFVGTDARYAFDENNETFGDKFESMYKPDGEKEEVWERKEKQDERWKERTTKLLAETEKIKEDGEKRLAEIREKYKKEREELWK